MHPWALHVPGLFFAEHGHQHHAVHRLPTLLLAAADDDARVDPAPLAAWTGRRGARLEAASSAFGALSAARTAERRAGTAAYLSLVDREAHRLGLTPQAARALWQLSSFRLLPAAAGTAEGVLRRHLPRSDHRAQPSPPSRAIARLLERHGSPVPWLISGHTHRAGERSLAGTTTRSLDTGTWCSDIRGPGPDREDGTRFPYVVLEASASGSEGSLRYWHDPGAQHLPAALAGGGVSAG